MDRPFAREELSSAMPSSYERANQAGMQNVASCIPKEEPPVSIALDQLRTEIAQLEEEFTRLEHRIQPYLRELLPETTGPAEGTCSMQPQSPLRRRLVDEAERINRMAQRVRGITGRVE